MIVRSLTGVACLLLLPACAHGANEPRDATRDQQLVCVPSEDGRRFDCGTRAKPPPERDLQSTASTPRSGAPPLFLAAPPPMAGAGSPSRAPVRARTDEFPRAPDREAASAEARSEAVPDQVATTAAPAAPPPMLAAPRARLSPYAPVDNGAPRTGPQAREPATVTPIVESQPVVAAQIDSGSVAGTPENDRSAANNSQAEDPQVRAQDAQTSDPPLPAAPESPQPAPAETAIVLRDAEQFLRLDPGRFSIQIARSDNQDSLRVTAQLLQLGALSDTLYALRIDADGQAQWLLLWSEFADAVSARSAWEGLARDGVSRPAAYPRRIGPLHDELRRAR